MLPTVALNNLLHYPGPMSKNGRNGPCPCGSGKKYKFCHGQAVTIANYDELTNPALLAAYEAFVESHPNDDSPSFMQWLCKPNGASQVSSALTAAMKGHSFDSSADLDQFVADWNITQNRQGIDEFLGLSPDSMYQILHGTMEDQRSIAHLRFDDLNQPADSVLLLQVADWLLAKCPISLTAAGYIPPVLAMDCWNGIISPYNFWNRNFDVPFKKESDSPLFMEIREIIEYVGLTKVRSGSLTLTKRGQGFLSMAPNDRYRALYTGFITSLDWKKLEREHLAQYHPLLQQSWLFALFILKQKAEDWISTHELAIIWIQAFPGFLQDYGITDQEPDNQAIKDLERMVGFYLFEYIPRLLGLVDIEPVTPGSLRLQCVRTSKFFHELIDWKTD